MKPIQTGELKVIKLTDEQTAQLDQIFDQLQMPNGPPTPNCYCQACAIKMMTVAAAEFVPGMLEKILEDVTEKRTGWMASGLEEFKKQVIAYYDTEVKPKILEGLKAELLKQHPEFSDKDMVLHVGKPEGILDLEEGPKANMPPAKA